MGINTTGSGFALPVKQNAFGTGMSMHLGMETNDCMMFQNTNLESTISTTNELFHLANNGTNVLTMYNGMVGIGSTIFTKKLKVKGNNKVIGSINALGTVVQMIVKTTETISLLNVTDYTEASTDFRINFIPKFDNRIVFIEYTFLINSYIAFNTVFDMQII